MKCHTIDYTHNTYLLLLKHLTSGTELILIGWKIVPNEEHVQRDPRFASQPLANEPLHSSQLFYSLFLHKTIQLSPFDLQSTAHCPPFYKLVTSIAFSMNYSIHSHVCNIDAMMLQF